MPRSPDPTSHGLGLLRAAVVAALAGALDVRHPALADGPLWSVAPETTPAPPPRRDAGADGGVGAGPGAPPPSDDPDAVRMAALVDLARAGDVEAFGLLYDHYQPMVYRFLHYRTPSTAVAEDLTSETFFRALRGLAGFRWQGRDFGAWLTTIARNLLLDHAKAARTRLEWSSDDVNDFETATEGPEHEVLAAVTGDLLRAAVARLAPEQRECVVLRFIEGCSIAETAVVLRRSEGAVKQLQLRAIRNLAAMMPEGMR